MLAGCSSTGRQQASSAASIPAAPPTPPPKGSGYAALGSSFAAGPRIPPNQGGACLRSNSNYAHLVAKALDLKLTDVSCSGAYASGLNLPSLDGTPSQLSSVTGTTRLVTVTAGGNDIGYAAAITTCTASARLGKSCLAGGTLLARSEKALAALRPTLMKLLAGVHSLAPKAQVYVLSYLAIFPADGVPCPPDVPLLAADDRALTALGLQLRDAIRSAALDGKAHFVDAYTAGLAHSACAPPAQRWVEGAKQVLPAFQYHPNARGMAAVANLLLTAIRQGT